MSNQHHHDVFHQSVMWHGVDMLPRLRLMSLADVRQVTNEANAHNLVEPLWEQADKKRFVVASWDAEPLSGAQVTALLVFGLWIQVGEREEMATSLLKMWPEIKVACDLCAMGVNRTADAICTIPGVQ